jgi:glutathione S-transferase
MEGECGVILHGYWRSSAAYRVRITLNLKQLSAEHAFHTCAGTSSADPIICA